MRRRRKGLLSGGSQRRAPPGFSPYLPVFLEAALGPLSPGFIDELCADYLLFPYLKQTHQQFAVQPNGPSWYEQLKVRRC